MRVRFVLAPAAFTAFAAFVVSVAWGAAALPQPGGGVPPPSPAGARASAVATGTPPPMLHGRISYYGRRFAGRPTARGEPFDPEALTMAHRSLPFGTQVRVTNPRNGRSVVVEVNDRGPAVEGRIADVSLAAARRLGMVQRGVIRARLQVLAEEDDDRGAPARGTPAPAAVPSPAAGASRPP